MQIFREIYTLNQTIFPASSVGELYGKKNMSGQTFLVAPLDIVIRQIVGGVSQYQPLITPGILKGSLVNSNTLGLIGKIHDYSFTPGIVLSWKPLVFIEPDPGLNLNSIMDIQTATIPPLIVGQSVNLFLDAGLTVSGIIAQVGIVNRNFPDGNSLVNAFRVDFSQHLLSDVHGARVFIGGSLLGMLIATQNQGDGSCHALVFPANQI
jgi:hypothetical protein